MEIGRDLLSFLEEVNPGLGSPRIHKIEREVIKIGEKNGTGLGGIDESEGNASKLPVKVSGDEHHGELPKNVDDGLGIAALKQRLFVLKNKRV